MLQRLLGYFLEHIQDETLIVPLYDKKTWRYCVSHPGLSYKSYHNLEKIVQIYLGWCARYSTCKIQYLRFINIRFLPYVSWCSSNRYRRGDFGSQMAYANMLSKNQKYLALENKQSRCISTNMLFTFYVHVKSFPYTITWDVRNIQQSLDLCLNSDMHSDVSYSVCPFVLPLCELVTEASQIQRYYERRHKIFSFTPKFPNVYIIHAEGDEEDDIAFCVPIIMTPKCCSNKIKLSYFNEHQDTTISIEKILPSVNLLLHDACPDYSEANPFLTSMASMIKQLE